MLLQMTLFCSFLWLSNIRVCVCVCVCVCIKETMGRAGVFPPYLSEVGCLPLRIVGNRMSVLVGIHLWMH